ncbi:MAG TPA: helix-turn-helix domain-containing protein [Candidatus Acidoferrales bacterium]|nr:helix-turn-helix domain-containing protein [Candidatus Acidoferrales bacterium]
MFNGKRNGDRGTRVYTSAELAEALGVCKMTVLRYVENGRLPRPRHFVQQEQQRTWLWEPGEFRRAIALVNGRK